MVISNEWSDDKEDNVDIARIVKETLLNDNWWMKVDYIYMLLLPLFMMFS